MLHILLCLVIMLVFHLLTPYWFWIMIVPFFYNLFRSTTGWKGFVHGASSAGLLWFLGSLFYFFTAGEFITQRVAEMFKLGSPWLLILITVLIAVLAGGFGGSSGALFAKMVNLKK